MEDSEAFGSGVGVLDKAALVLSALEAGPAPLAQLVATTGLAFFGAGGALSYAGGGKGPRL